MKHSVLQIVIWSQPVAVLFIFKSSQASQVTSLRVNPCNLVHVCSNDAHETSMNMIPPHDLHELSLDYLYNACKYCM